MMASPPSHWVRERQNIIERGNASILLITHAPVVVNPEQDSKNASAKDGKTPDRINGKEPMRDATSHEKLMTKNFCRNIRLREIGLVQKRARPPRITQPKITSAKANSDALSPYAKARTRGITIAAASP